MGFCGGGSFGVEEKGGGGGGGGAYGGSGGKMEKGDAMAVWVMVVALAMILGFRV